MDVVRVLILKATDPEYYENQLCPSGKPTMILPSNGNGPFQTAENFGGLCMNSSLFFLAPGFQYSYSIHAFS